MFISNLSTMFLLLLHLATLFTAILANPNAQVSNPQDQLNPGSDEQTGSSDVAPDVNNSDHSYYMSVSGDEVKNDETPIVLTSSDVSTPFVTPLTDELSTPSDPLIPSSPTSPLAQVSSTNMFVDLANPFVLADSSQPKKSTTTCLEPLKMNAEERGTGVQTAPGADSPDPDICNTDSSGSNNPNSAGTGNSGGARPPGRGPTEKQSPIPYQQRASEHRARQREQREQHAREREKQQEVIDAYDPGFDCSKMAGNPKSEAGGTMEGIEMVGRNLKSRFCCSGGSPPSYTRGDEEYATEERRQQLRTMRSSCIDCMFPSALM